MAVAKKTSLGGVKRVKVPVNRRGIHAKTKMSKNKHSKNYVKLSRGQG